MFWSVLEQLPPTPVTFCHGEFLFLRLPSSSCRGLVIAMVASLIFIVLLRFLAGIMVWVMIVLVILVLGYGERCPRGWEPSPCSPCFPFPPLSRVCMQKPPRPSPWTQILVGLSSTSLSAVECQYDDFLLSTPGIFHCYMEYAKLKGEAGSDVSLTDLGFQTDLRVYLHLRQTWLAFSESLSTENVLGREEHGDFRAFLASW